MIKRTNMCWLFTILVFGIVIVIVTSMYFLRRTEYQEFMGKWMIDFERKKPGIINSCKGGRPERKGYFLYRMIIHTMSTAIINIIQKTMFKTIISVSYLL